LNVATQIGRITTHFLQRIRYALSYCTAALYQLVNREYTSSRWQTLQEKWIELNIVKTCCAWFWRDSTYDISYSDPNQTRPILFRKRRWEDFKAFHQL